MILVLLSIFAQTTVVLTLMKKNNYGYLFKY